MTEGSKKSSDFVPRGQLFAGIVVLLVLAGAGGWSQYESSKQVLALAGEKEAWELNAASRKEALDVVLQGKRKQMDELQVQLNKDKEACEAFLKKVRDRISAAEREAVLAQGKIKEFQKSKANSEKAASTALQQRDIQEKANTLALAKAKDLEKKCAVAQTQLEALEARKAKLSSDIESATKAIAKSQATQVAITKDIESAKVELDRTKKSIGKLTSQKDLLAKLETQWDTLSKTVSGLEAVRDSLKGEIQKLGKTKGELVAANTDFTKQKKELATKNEALVKKNTALRNEINETMKLKKALLQSIEIQKSNHEIWKAMVKSEKAVHKKLAEERESTAKLLEKDEVSRIREQKLLMQVTTQLEASRLELAKLKKDLENAGVFRKKADEYEKAAKAMRATMAKAEIDVAAVQQKLNALNARYAAKQEALRQLDKEAEKKTKEAPKDDNPKPEQKK